MMVILRKELREHWLAFLVLTILTGGLFLLILLGYYTNPNGPGVHEAYRAYLGLSSLVSGLVLSHFLVSKEYSGKTQFFLESLPVGRYQVFAAKWFLGLAVLLAIQLGMFALTSAIALSREPIEMKFVGIALARTAAWLLFTHTCFFAYGLLGRYRLFCVFVVFTGLVAIDNASQLRLFEIGPFGLINPNRFAVERDALPLYDLGITAFWSLGALLISLAMMATREGSLASGLAVKMSYREKVFIAGVMVAVIFSISVLESREKPEPYTLVDAMAVTDDKVQVHMAETGLLNNSAPREFLNWLHAELAGVKDFLDMERLPPVFITVRRDLDPDKYELGYLKGKDGLLARVHYDPESWDREAFLAWLLPILLNKATYGRAALERNHWLLDGFAFFWSQGREEDMESTGPLMLRALYGTPEGITRTDLDQWLRFREQRGKSIAGSVAWSGLALLSRQYGADVLQNLLRRKLGQVPPVDARATVQEYRNALPTVFQELSGVGYDDFLSLWDRELRHHQRRMKESLSALPRLQGAVKLVQLSRDSHALEYKLVEALDDDTRIRFNHTRLAYDSNTITPDDVYSEDMNAGRLATWQRLPQGFRRGTLLAWSFTMRSEILKCDIGTGWQRMEVR
ncbi:MAG: hypothetical protein QNK37_26300 [Acidobacteriota bacterium]|nr:hypothetical protein [Acidobacteriota bacterium]